MVKKMKKPSNLGLNHQPLEALEGSSWKLPFHALQHRKSMK
jgi:hypothetical protein